MYTCVSVLIPQLSHNPMAVTLIHCKYTECTTLTLKGLVWQKFDVGTSFGSITGHVIKGPGSGVEFWTEICSNENAFAFTENEKAPDLSAWC